MAYTKTDWQARQGTGLNRFTKTQETADAANFTNEPLSITRPGTPFSAENMNHIEQGIEDAHEMIAAEAQTREQGDNELAQAIEEAVHEHNENEDAHAGIRASIAAEAQTREQTINAESHAREQGDNELAQAIEEAVREHDENEDAHAGIRTSIAAEAQTREQTINAEAQARHASDQTLQGNIDSANNDFKKLEDDFHAWIGRGGYLEAYDFGTSTPSQNDLTNQALSQIASITNSVQVWNGTKIENLFDGHLWALTNTQDTDPPIFEWSDQGPASISPFAQDSGGYIVGADPNTDGGGYVQAMPGGKGKIIGWEQITASSSFLAAHPVGSIYLSVDPVNPGIQYGGTWVAWGKGKVPVGVDTADTIFNEAGKEGGAKTHTLSKEEMPVHTHTQNSHEHPQTNHNHIQSGHTHTQAAHSHNGSQYASNTSGSAVTTAKVETFSPAASETVKTDVVKTATPTINSATAVNQGAKAAIEAATAVNQNTGGGAAHNNLQPYITCYMWRRTE